MQDSTRAERIAESASAKAVVDKVGALLSRAGVAPSWGSSRDNLGFLRVSERVKPLLSTDAVKHARAPASVALPRTIDLAVTLADRGSGLSVDFRVLQAPPLPVANGA